MKRGDWSGCKPGEKMGNGILKTLKICNLCKKPIDDPVSEAYYDQDQKEIVYRHQNSYCQKKANGPYAYMRRHGQTKHD